ncbi:MAG TPA: pitrilysin family protein [Thermoanaerobaculia bacterium]|nr:pitrilysin family protein [Thermoanaerobaculia bacterium]
MRRIFIAALMFLVATGAMAQQKPASKPAATSASSDILPFKATEKTLPNGLKVIVVPTGFPNIVSLQIPVKTGSRNEVEPGKSGFAHFFEHMMFRGTAKYPTAAYQDIITNAGARQNAYTTDDFTNYHITFAKEDLEKMLEIEADRFMNLRYSEEDFKTESRAVLGEYNKNSANPFSKLFEVQRDNAFTTHTYKHTTMGFLADIEEMPNQFDYSKTFFDRWYRPENTAIIIAGDVEPAKAIALVEKYWGSWKRGTYKVDIPQEPEPKGPKYAHVPWDTPTLPIVSVGFHGPAFSETNREMAAVNMLLDVYFGQTSDLYKKLVEQEQKVDVLFAFQPLNEDPSLITIGARLKNIDDALHVRQEILETVAKARAETLPEQRLAAAKSNARYGFARTLDNTDAIASTLARFVRYSRSYDTLNQIYRLFDALTPADLNAGARKWLTDNRMIVTTLSTQPMPAAMAQIPSLASVAPAAASGDDLRVLRQVSQLPQLNVKLLFEVGSAKDPNGKEGLAVLSASMVSDAGSKAMRIDEINKALYPMAGGFGSLVDKEMTTFTGSIHKDNAAKFFDIVLPQLLDPGYREEDFKRLKDLQLNSLRVNLRANNEEELGKERLQQVIFAGTRYAHPVLGTVAGIESITLDDVRSFVRDNYTRANLTIGVAGDASDATLARLKSELAALPAGGAKTADALEPFAIARPNGMKVDIIQKETRATAISFGHPIEVTRSHPDFVALTVARAWLGEHRTSMSHLYNRIREIRGMNYGDYAYIEAFPRGMFQFFPDPNIARRNQIFEVWIRHVAPENAHMALRIAVNELEKLIDAGLSAEDFEKSRGYLMKNVYVMTSTQNQQLGYALDSQWYGIPEYTKYMRDGLSRLTVDDVNRAVKKHLSAKNLHVVIITKDAEGLKQQLVSDAFSPIKYDATKPQELLDEDKVIGAKKLAIAAANVRITPVDEIFAK